MREVASSNDMTVEILRHPTEEDWTRCYNLALNTVRKESDKIPSEEWKRKILKAEHSPIRTLMFTIRMRIPYWVSVHFCRHKIGVEHYVTSQRNDRQSEYDRNKAPQDAPVVHVMDLNAQALMNIIRTRVCGKTANETRQVAWMIYKLVLECNPEFECVLHPKCVHMGGCNEIDGCGWYDPS